MIKLLNILKENSGIPGLEAIRDWVVDDYNSGFGYNPDANIKTILEALKSEIYRGKIYRAISVPEDVTDVKSYIWHNGKGRYASFSDYLGGVKYYLPYIEDSKDKTVIISQVTSYYSLSEWYTHNFDKLEKLHETFPEKYWWIDENLPEVSNTGEAIAKLDRDFEIIG